MRSFRTRSHMASTPLALVRMSQSYDLIFFRASSSGRYDCGLRISMKGISITDAPRLRRLAERLPAWWRARPTRIRVPARGRFSLALIDQVFGSAAVLGGCPRPARRGRDALGTAGKMPALHSTAAAVARSLLRKPLRE